MDVCSQLEVEHEQYISYAVRIFEAKKISKKNTDNIHCQCNSYEGETRKLVHERVER